MQAHSIKDRKCNTAKAVFALESSFKWALSGTPLQNRVGELYSLVSIIGDHSITVICIFFRSLHQRGPNNLPNCSSKFKNADQVPPYKPILVLLLQRLRL